MGSITYTPPPATLSWWRWLLARLPRFCKYCGKHYVRISGGPERFNPFVPLGENGRGCPDGHEGYLDAFHGYFIERTHVDNVKSQSVSTLTDTA